MYPLDVVVEVTKPKFDHVPGFPELDLARKIADYSKRSVFYLHAPGD